MMRMTQPKFLAALAAGLILAGAAVAQGKQRRGNAGTPFLGFGSNSREPVKVDANRLEVFDKESKAVYSGDVVAVQGPEHPALREHDHLVFARRVAGRLPPGLDLDPADRVRRPGFAPLRHAFATSQRDDLPRRNRHRDADGKVVIADCENVQRGERVVL